MTRFPSPWELVGVDTSWVCSDSAAWSLWSLICTSKCTATVPACQWGNPVVTLFSSTISKSSHGMRNVGSIREQSNASTLIFSEVHCALHGRTKYHDMVAAMSDAFQ